MIYGGCAGGNKCRVASVAEAAASVSSRTLIDISRVKLSPPTVSTGHKASVAQLGIFFRWSKIRILGDGGPRKLTTS